MTDQVRLGELNGEMVARISRPGIDVKAAKFGDRLFDGNGERWTRWMEGQTAYTDFINSTTARTFTVNFGRTFLRPPPVLFVTLRSIITGAGGPYDETGTNYGRAYQRTGSADHGENYRVQIGLSSMLFVVQIFDSAHWGTAIRHRYAFRYAVFDMEIAT